MLNYERTLWNKSVRRVAGVDEAGRGPLAGPVVAAAVCFDPAFARTEAEGLLSGLTDSKKLTRQRREYFKNLLLSRSECSVSVGVADVAEIDRINILQATYLAMRRALDGLSPAAEHALVDGLPVPDLPCASTAIIKGDACSLSIAAASVVAKVVRDALMRELDARYPGYGLATHKGYGTQKHMAALMDLGPCGVHRRSFRPVREAMAIHEWTASRS